MTFDRDHDGERPGLLTRLAIAALAFVVSVLVAVIADTPSAQAICGNDCNPDPVDYYSTLTVARPSAGVITSNAVGENQINCPSSGGGTCSVTDVQTVPGARPSSGWPVYTLTAVEPAGYAYRWESPCSGTAPCQVTNDSDSADAIGGSVVDVAAPSTPTISAPDYANGSTQIQASSTDNSGAVSYLWTACNVGSCVPFAAHTASITLGSLWDDTWTVHVAASDGAGNVSTQATKNVVLDTSAPTVHITSPAMYAAANGPDVATTFTAIDANPATVTCSIDAGTPAPCSNGTWTATGLSPGLTHTITVTATDKAGNVGGDYVLVWATPIGMTLKVNPNALGSLTAFQATDFPQSATGTVRFHTGDGVDICTATVQSAEAHCLAAPTMLTGADHEVIADYSGDQHLFAATAQISVEPTVQDFSYTVAAQAGTLAYGTKHALVMSGAPADLTGTVTFKAGTKVLCTATVSAGSATCLAGPGSLTPGSHTVTFVASGDADYANETSTFAVAITKGTPALTERLSAATVHKGRSVTATASGVPAGGSVTFLVGTTKICTATAVSGRASCATPKTLSANSYQVVARFAGSALWKAASATAGLTVVR